MRSPIFRITRSLIITTLVIIINLGYFQTASAQGIVLGDTVPSGTTVNSDGILFGDRISINGTVDGDVLAVGGEVVIDGNVNGSLIVVGNNVSIDGEVGGTVYVGSIKLDLGPKTNLARNLYFAGLRFANAEGSVVERDLKAAVFSDATFNGTINGNFNTIVGPVKFFELIMNKVDEAGLFSSALPINTLTEEQNILPPNQTNGVHIAMTSMSGLLPAFNIIEKVEIMQAGGIDWEAIGTWLLDRLRDFGTLLIFGLLAIWLIPKVITGSTEKLSSKPLPSTGYGLLGLVIAFNIAGLVILLAFLILAIGLFLGFTTMWELAWAFMALGFFSLGLAATIFALFVLYISKVIVAYMVGRSIIDRIAPKIAKYKVLSLLLGLIIYVFLVSIPILGFVIAIFVTAVGVGAAWLYYLSTRSGNKKEDGSKLLEEASNAGANEEQE